MHDIGKERDRMETASPSEPRGKSYPSISLNESQCPFIKDWPTGSDYELVIKVHKTGDHEPQAWEYNGDKGMMHEFEIRQVGYKDDDEKEKT